MVGRLPHYYTDVPPVTTNMKNISVPATSVVSLARDNFKAQAEEEYMWLEHVRRVIEENTGTDENISWSAFHASRQLQLARTLSSAPSGIPDDVMHTIERFVILLYDRTSTCKEINKARKIIFAKKNNLQLIPPTKAALAEHVKRTAYQ